MHIQPYLMFSGRCDEAVAFYQQALGAELLMLMRYKDSPEPPAPGMVAPGSEDKVMHVSLRIGNTTVMASDGDCGGTPDFRGVTLYLEADDAAAAERLYNALADGGQVHMPLGKTFWSPCFGMLADRFGVAWMVSVPMQ